MDRTLLLSALSCSGEVIVNQRVELNVDCTSTLSDIYRSLGIDNREAISCSLLQNACTPIEQSLEWTKLSSTMQEVDTQCMQLAYPICSVLRFRVSSAQHAVARVPSASECRSSNAIAALMVSGQALYERNLMLSDEEVAGWLKPESAKGALARELCHQLQLEGAGFLASESSACSVILFNSSH